MVAKRIPTIMPEFKRSAFEVLRSPLENGGVTISQSYWEDPPSQLYHACGHHEPLAWGYLDDQSCTATLDLTLPYARISGPLLDRIDLHIEVPAVSYRDLAGGPAGTSSVQMRDEVTVARSVQKQRFARSRTLRNGQMSHRQIRTFCKLDTAGEQLLKTAMDALGLSARAHDKILRVARTIADLEQSEAIAPDHLSEAIGYRTLDRQMSV